MELTPLVLQSQPPITLAARSPIVCWECARNAAHYEAGRRGALESGLALAS